MNVRHDMIVCHAIRPSADASSHEFLQLRRAARDFMGGAWGPVRGHIEPGETAWQAALRELKEEAGLSSREFYQLDTIDSFYLAGNDTIYNCPGFVAIVGRGDAVTLSDEHDGERWLPREAAAAHMLWPGERLQVREACEVILDGGIAKPYLRIQLSGPAPGTAGGGAHP